MKNVIRTSWRDAATLIVLSKKVAIPPRQGVNYDILFQTRTASASFANSVVFPGGVSEPSDASDEWLTLFRSFGFGQGHFEAFHRVGAPVTPILRDNPVKRHIALRITAIRETFEELGLLLCSREQQKDRSSLAARIVLDLDVKHWQGKVSKNPKELLTLCKELGCYPDIWALQYWSNWLTPTHLPKRFDTAFFITALEHRPKDLKSSHEVVHAQVSKNPKELLTLCKELGCYPDIWALQYWSNWLTPTHLPKRFDTAFFITALEHRPKDLKSSHEVVHAQWSSPEDILAKYNARQLVLFPPQSYELHRLCSSPDCDELLQFAAARNGEGNTLLYPVVIQAKDGEVNLLPGDELYPPHLDYINDGKIIQKDKTVLEIRENCHTLHRFESGEKNQFIVKNCKLDNHLDMGDRVIPLVL